MGAWGTGPLENDDALDFLESLRRTKKQHRLRKAIAAIESYVSFDSRLVAGTNISVLSDSDIADLWKSRDMTLQWHKSEGLPVPYDILPELKTEESYAAYIAEMAKPQVDDGAKEANRLLVVCHVLIEALYDSTGLLSQHSRAELLTAASMCSDAIGRLLNNKPYADQWAPENYKRLTEQSKEMSRRLAAAT